MATTTSAKPYVVPEAAVVPEGAVAPEVETRSGWVTFAGVVFLIGAVANLFWGLAAIDSKAFLDETGLLYSTLETWGWIAIGWSAVLALGGIVLLARMRSGPVIGIILAALSCFFWLFALPVMPFYAATIILIDVLMIYGLATTTNE